jgi:hypothetical protein
MNRKMLNDSNRMLPTRQKGAGQAKHKKVAW